MFHPAHAKVRVSKNKTTRMVIKLADFQRKSCGMMRPRFNERAWREDLSPCRKIIAAIWFVAVSQAIVRRNRVLKGEYLLSF
jgi:hypothetical protein